MTKAFSSRIRIGTLSHLSTSSPNIYDCIGAAHIINIINFFLIFSSLLAQQQ